MAKKKKSKVLTEISSDVTRVSAAKVKLERSWNLSPQVLAITLAFIAGLLFFDRSFFLVLKLCNRHNLQGPETINQTLHTHADAYIFGDSRAKYHIDPAVLNAEVGLNFFNAGASGYDILYYRCLCELLEKRTKPKLYVINISLDDFHRNPAQYGSMNIFAAYMDESAVVRAMLVKQSWRAVPALQRIGHDRQASMLKDFPWDVAWPYVCKSYVTLMGIKTYRFNAKLYYFVEAALGRPLASSDGFVPLSNTPFQAAKRRYVMAQDVDFALVNELIQCVRQAQSKGICVILSVAPSFRMTYSLAPDEWYYLYAIRQSAKLLHVPLIEISEHNHPHYRDALYYFDRDHFNARGAAFYSQHLALHIARVLSLPDIAGTPYEAHIEPDQYVIPASLFDP